MNVFTVHEPPNPPPKRLQRGERLVFVPEKFSWTAAILGPVWMLMHRMWLVLLGYLALALAMEGGLAALGVESQWISLSFVALQIAIGFEAGALRRWTLERKRWTMLGAVTGRSATDAERRFFEAWLAPPAGPHETLGDTPDPIVQKIITPRLPWLRWGRLFSARA